MPYVKVQLNKLPKGYFMLDTRESGIDYSKEQLEKLPKISDLFINENREIYAELLRDENHNTIYFREWFTNTGSNYNFAIISSSDELKQELKKDVDHGDLAPGRVSKIISDNQSVFIQD